MNNGFLPIVVVTLALGLCTCGDKEDEPQVDPVTASLVGTLNKELEPLSADPTLQPR